MAADSGATGLQHPETLASCPPATLLLVSGGEDVKIQQLLMLYPMLPRATSGHAVGSLMKGLRNNSLSLGPYEMFHTKARTLKSHPKEEEEGKGPN